jgi:hypothetical protein
MSAHAKPFHSYDVKELVIQATPDAKRQAIKINGGKDYNLFKLVGRITRLHISNFDTDSTIKQCHCNIGPYGISRDPNDRTKFINHKAAVRTLEDGTVVRYTGADVITDEEFEHAVRLFEAFDRHDERILEGLAAMRIKPTNYKWTVRCSDAADADPDDPKYVTAHLKLQTYADPDDPKARGIKRPANADSDYCVTFMRGKKRITFQQALIQSKNCLASLEFTSSAVYKSTGGTTAQYRVKRYDIQEPGTDPTAGYVPTGTTEEYLDDLGMSQAMRNKAKAARLAAEAEDEAEAAREQVPEPIGTRAGQDPQNGGEGEEDGGDEDE